MIRTALPVLLIAGLTGFASAELVAYYSFDGSDAADQSAKGNHGTVGTSMGFSPATPFGSGQALQATGVSGNAGLVSVPNAPSLEGIRHQLSLSAWIKADVTQNSAWFRFMRKGTESNPGQTWMWNRNASTQDTNMRIDTSDGVTGTFNMNRGRDADIVLDNQWHQLVFTLDNGNWAEYLDGVASGSGTYDHGNGFSNTEALLIAGRGQNMTGFLDDIGVWDHALSPGEARAIQQFASTGALGYHLGKVNQLFALTLGQQVLIDGRTWFGVSGLAGAEGDLEAGGGQFAINFAGGLGVMTIPEPSDLAFTRIHLDPVSDRLALRWTSRDQVLYDLLYSNDPTATFDPSAWSILTNGVSGTESSTEIFLPDFQGQSWSRVAPWWVFRLREQ